MTFLPIIERELRVRGRRRETYWLRCSVVLAGALGCLPQLLWSGLIGTGATVGPGLLTGLVIAAFLLCCVACLLTADVISAERREGTLGLLLLTHVGGFDILIGKLCSAGLTGLCALVAFLPLLMLPVLAGGVTGYEAFRMSLVLTDTLFLALAAGLWASARGCDWFKTACTALLVVTISLLGPGLLELTLGRSLGLGRSFWLLSPLSALIGAGDSTFSTSPGRYWTSLALVQATAWALIFSSGFRLQRAWQEEQGEALVPEPEPVGEATAQADGPWLSCTWTPPVLRLEGEGAAEPGSAQSRPLGRDGNPIDWLLNRQSGTRAILWAGALLSLAFHGLPGMSSRFLGTRWYWMAALPLNLTERLVAGALFAWAASRFLVEAWRTGELELLLTTPFGIRQLVTAQWRTLKRLLRWPMLVMLAPACLTLIFAAATKQYWLGPTSSLFRLHYVVSELLYCANLFMGMGALCWMGLWFGLQAVGQSRTILWAVGVAWGPPYLLGILSSILFSAVGAYSFRRGPGLEFLIAQWLPQFVNLAYYVTLIYTARRRLLSELTTGEPMRFGLRESLSSMAREILAGLGKTRHWTPS